MTKTIFTGVSLIAVCISLNAVHANAQAWEWAKSSAGISADEAASVAVSYDGYTYVTGHFESPTITFGTTTLPNAGYDDIFLVKYDHAGNVIWAKQAGGALSDISNSVTTDLAGNVYITGAFESPSINFGTTNLSNPGDYHVFIAKYDSAGNVLWAKSAGGAGGADYDAAAAVVADLSGSIYITGFFRSPIISFDTDTLANSGNDDVFLAKYDTAGHIIWAKRAGGSGYDYATALAADPSGNVYITGYFQSTAIAFGASALTSTGSGNIFLAKYNAAGDVVWAKSSRDSAGGIPSSIATGPSGSIYVSGYFTSPSITFDTITLINAGSSTDDVFLIKYDTAGNTIWAKSAGGNGDDLAYAVTTDLPGNIYLCGMFQSATITFGTTSLTNAGTGNMFLTKYDPSGNILWATGEGGSNIDVAKSVTTDASGIVYLTGFFGSPLLTFGPTTLTNPGGTDIFLAKYNEGALNTTVVNSPATGSFIYPIPTTSQLTILSANQPISLLIITNLLGQTVYTHRYNTQQVQVDVSGLPKGMYFIKANGSEAGKFVKE